METLTPSISQMELFYPRLSEPFSFFFFVVVVSVGEFCKTLCIFQYELIVKYKHFLM